MNNTTNTTHECSARANPRERGVAMILVLVSISVAIVIAGIALTTRDTTSAIGENAVAAAEASWAAESAAELSAKVIEKNISTWTASVDSTLMQDMDFGDANVTVKITDMDGNDPEPDDEMLRMTVVSEANGVTREIVREIAVSQPVEMEGAADPWLKEFAIFAVERLRLSDSVNFRVWDMSEKSGVNPSFKIGGQFPSTSELDFANADLVNVEFYPTTSTPTAVKDMVDESIFYHGWVIPMEPPVFSCAVPTALRTSSLLGPLNLSGAAIEFDGNSTPMFRFSGMALSDSANITIRNDVMMMIEGDFSLDSGASIDLAEGASLMLYVTGDIDIRNNATFGLPEGVTQYSDMLDYASADDAWIIAVDQTQGGKVSPSIQIQTLCVIKACVHAPQSDVVLADSTMFIGRLTGYRISMDQTKFLYDPSLDNLAGFTNNEGPLYDQTTYLPVDGLETAVSTYDWTLGMNYFYNWIDDQVATDPDAGESGGVTIRLDTATEFTKVFESKFMISEF